MKWAEHYPRTMALVLGVAALELLVALTMISTRGL